MTEPKMCGVCNRNEAAVVCTECGIPLCEACTREVIISDMSLGARVKGVVLSPVRPGEQKKKVCEKCLMEGDFE